MAALSVVALFCWALPATAAREVLIRHPDELKQVLKSAKPGDTLVLRNGEWNDAKIIVESEGTADAPITIRAETPGKVLLTGESVIRLGGSHLVVDGFCFINGHAEDAHAVSFRTNDKRKARNCRLTNTAFLDYNPPSRDSSSYWVSLYGISNRVDHCRFQGKNDGSPTVTVWVEDEPNYHHIDYNQFIHRPPLGRNGGETMRVGDSKMSLHNSRTLVEYNYFEDCSGEGEIISNKSCENLYRHNVFIECQGALVLRHGNRCQVEGNWFLGRDREGTGGVRIIGEDHLIVNNYFDSLAGTDFESALPFVNGIPNSQLNEYFQIKRATVAFNTFVNCRQTITFGAGVGRRNRAEPPLDCLLANNLIVGTNGPLIHVEDAPVRARWVGNLHYGADLGLAPTPGLTAADPLLVRDTNGVWSPGPGSPALGAALGNGPAPQTDIHGTTRGSKPSVGCWEPPGNTDAQPRPWGKGAGPDWLNFP